MNIIRAKYDILDIEAFLWNSFGIEGPKFLYSHILKGFETVGNENDFGNAKELAWVSRLIIFHITVLENIDNLKMIHLIKLIKNKNLIIFSIKNLF